MVIASEYTEGSSSSANDHKYDVFLSFRGADTRHSFTDHLHKALLGANISTFLDDDKIETGGNLKPELESAIKESRASIIVLSKNYANSSWCLDELVRILREGKTSNQIVIPIFYRVEPTHVRKQKSSFRVAMTKHKRAMEAETDPNKRSQLAQKIDRWSQALNEVSNLKGMNVDGRRETEFIDEIVDDIFRRLRISSRIPLPRLFGMHFSKEFVTSWLKDTSSHTADILTISGMGGIGKTSLAKYVYGLHYDKFDTSSFIENISGKCDDIFNGLLNIQKQLHDDISKSSSKQVHDVTLYTSKIEEAIACKKVFLVLDDIDSLDKLDALLGSKGFHPGSKIIITTKDAYLTKSCALFKTKIKPTHTEHMVQGLYKAEAKQLLCFHAFMPNDPIEGYEEVLDKLLMYCEGNPLALKVLGSSLLKHDVAYWEEFMEGLKKENDTRINNVLRKSFDSLPSENDKELFKHIACFFVGMDRYFIETILTACGIRTRSGIVNLIDKCLLSIGPNNKLMMHGLLQEIGRFVVRQESPMKPWKRSRLWCHEESFEVLKKKKGKGNLLGLTLDMRMLEKEKLRGSFELQTDALSKLENLMLLQLNYVQIDGSYHKLSNELRWLCMHGYPSECIPSNLPMDNLVALDMSYSNIKSFVNSRGKLTRSCTKEKRLLGSLKILNLSFCEHLCSLFGFVEVPALERLTASNCNKLIDVCESIEQCVELVYIDLSYCEKLEKLNIGMLKKVKTLLLDGFNLGSSQTKIRDMVKANHIGINTKFSSSAVSEAIPSDSKFFTISFPTSLVKLSLTNNNLSTESFPMDLSCLSMLEALYLDKNPISSMPDCVRSLCRLHTLSMEHCERLTSVEHPPSTLTFLNVFSDQKNLLRKVLFNPKMCPLDLFLPWHSVAPPSCEIEGMIKIQPMEVVEEKLLHSLRWNKLDFLNKRGVQTYPKEYKIQMYYEFGIFSTIYKGKDILNWIRLRSKGPSISFTVPSSPKKLRGLNFCCVCTHQRPIIIVHNISKNRTWMYDHCILEIIDHENCFTMLSHWMFGMNEMEGGDEVTITVKHSSSSKEVAEECGVSFVYDDGNTEEENVLSYYKSWNHIIGGDLTGYQLTTGEYILCIRRITTVGVEAYMRYPKLVGHLTCYKEESMWFTALSQRKPDILGQGTGSSTGKALIQNDEDEVKVIVEQ